MRDIPYIFCRRIFNMTSILKAAFVGVAVAGLSACGGGGGGSSTLSPFVSWGTLNQPNQSFSVSGLALETSAVSDPLTEALISATDATPTTVTLTGTLDQLGEGLAAFGISSSSGQSLLFSSGIGGGDGAISAQSADETKFLTAIDPGELEWNFQTFGFWSNSNANFSQSTVGVYSVGAETLSSGVPSTGTATYTGLAAGFVATAGAQPSEFAAVLTAQTDFAARTLNLVSTTLEGPQDTSFSGSLTFSAGSASFSGNVSTANQVMTGTASGRFYGPGAEEIGGIFALGGQNSRMLGAFGAAR